MKIRNCLLSTIPFLLTFFSTAGFAQESAQDWLMKMSLAAKNMNYDGKFVYQHGNQLEAMRITHQANNNGVRERLVSLNGAPREIIRNNDMVRCYLPDEDSVMVSSRNPQAKKFPGLLPSSMERLNESYLIKTGKISRIANRSAQLILIRPQDRYRYGYRLWADTKTGLLLKADLVNQQGESLEQFMFTDIEINKSLSDSDFEPSFDNSKMVWHKEPGSPKKELSQSNWRAQRLPKGFNLTASLNRFKPTKGEPMIHLVYSDGLAAVSVFIERGHGDSASMSQGANQMGAVHAYRAMVEGYQVTVVGEVPAETVEMIGSSITMTE
ncbi:MAG: MucB/RseB C-terminal domain-containing protein [Gammaproteobacteria bacterium]|nr:MucB/RseB C-terminal domain-containing protein [Gammaproteobacteria bacterium]